MKEKEEQFLKSVVQQHRTEAEYLFISSSCDEYDVDTWEEINLWNVRSGLRQSVLLRRKTLSLSLAPGERQSARAETATGQTSWALDETLDPVSVSNLQDKHKCVNLLLKQLYIYFNV